MNRSEQLEELEISFWRRVIRRRRWLIATVVVLFAAVTVSVLLLRPTTYSATTEVFVTGSEVTPEVQFIQSKHVLDQVARELGHQPEISVDADTSTWIITIKATGESPEAAIRAADTYASTYVSLREQAANQAWHATVTELQRAIDATQEKLRALPPGDPTGEAARLERDLAAYQESLSAATTGSFSESRARPVVLSPASARANGGTQYTVLYGIAAAAVGLVAGIGIAGISLGLDTRVAGPAGAAQALRAPLLGRAPSANELMYSRPRGWRRRRRWQGDDKLLAGPGSPEAETIGLVRARLLPVDRKKLRGAVHICCADVGDRADAAAVAITLAHSFAQSGVRTALVWADYRYAPDMLDILGVDSAGHGLAEVLADRCPLPAALRQSPRVPGLSVLTPGDPPPSVVDFFSGRGFAQLMADIVTMDDVVVVHTPPLANHADGQLVAQVVDASVVVASAQTRRGLLEQAQDDLRAAGANLEGVVFSGVAQL